MTTSLKQIIPLSLALFVLLAYHFMGASTWTDAPASPPNNNVPAPINVGTSTDSRQTIEGGLAIDNFVATNISYAGSQVRAPLYCDEDGNNCSAPPFGGVSCTTETQVVQSCHSAPTCPAGWSASGPVTWGGGCDHETQYQQLTCNRMVCDDSGAGMLTCSAGETLEHDGSEWQCVSNGGGLGLGDSVSDGDFPALTEAIIDANCTYGNRMNLGHFSGRPNDVSFSGNGNLAVLYSGATSCGFHCEDYTCRISYDGTTWRNEGGASISRGGPEGPG